MPQNELAPAAARIEGRPAGVPPPRRPAEMPGPGYEQEQSSDDDDDKPKSTDIKPADKKTAEQSFFQRNKKAITAATVLGAVGAVGVAGYVYREELKKYFNWNKLANGAVEDSTDLLVAKLSLAINLYNVNPTNPEVLNALNSAKLEARKLLNMNAMLQEKLDRIASEQPE